MPRKNFKVKGVVWLYPGMSGWHFVYLEKKLSEKIRKHWGKGLIKIEATMGDTTWKTSLLPDTRSGTYLIALKADVRRREHIHDGDQVKINFKVIKDV